MIFGDNIKKDFAELTYKNMTLAVVYRGKQPTAAEYISGINNGTYTWSGNFLLQAYKNIQLNVRKIESTYRVEKTSPSRTLHGDFMCQNGTAEWAALFNKTMIEGSNKLLEFDLSSNTVNFLRNITDDDLFMIVPVTDMLGDGVLRFISIDFYTDENNPLKQYSLNFSII